MSELNIQLGAYGWMHAQWNDVFYPEDLPLDWQLSYYSNEFNTVLVPASYWAKERGVNNQKSGQKTDQTFTCDDWLDSVHDKFQFYVECSAAMFDDDSMPDFKKSLHVLQPQLAGLVFFDGITTLSTSVSAPSQASVKKELTNLAKELGVAVFSGDVCRQDHQAIYFQAAEYSSMQNQRPGLALIENDLLDLRAAKEIVEDYVAQDFVTQDFITQIGSKDMIYSNGISDVNDFSPCPCSEQSTIIVNHPALSANDLVKFRSVLEIMGF